MPLPPRTLAALLALALAAPAQAANPNAPGAQKQQDSASAPSVPAARSAPQANAPQGATAPVAPVTGKAKAVGKAQTGKSTTHPIQAQSGPAPQASHPAAKVRAHGHRATRMPTVARQRATPHRAVHRRIHPVAHRTPAKRAHAPRASIAAPAAAGVAARPRRRLRHGAAGRVPHPAAAKPAQSTAPLTVISRAADNVVEVIPGTVVLALAGLATLVLMLIIRSLATERRRGKALATSYGVTVEALATAIEAKDHTTGGHIERVRRLGVLLASQMVPREAREPQMAYGFLLHDIGKLAVPDAILRAPGRLTAEQWALMRRHPEEGVRMLESVPFLDRALDVVRHHHERWDGGGYPDGLRGEEIPLWARIFAVVDALDAMTAERPYRAARTYDEALAEIRCHAGTQFDPAVVEALEHLDPDQVVPLLEPNQRLDAPVKPLAELPEPGPLVAA